MRRPLKSAELDEIQPAGSAVRRIQSINTNLSSVRIASHVYLQIVE